MLIDEGRLDGDESSPSQSGRRHLSESQRAMVATKLANLSHGGDRRSNQAANLPLEAMPQVAAAELLNVSERSVRDAKVIERESAHKAEVSK